MEDIPGLSEAAWHAAHEQRIAAHHEQARLHGAVSVKPVSTLAQRIVAYLERQAGPAGVRQIVEGVGHRHGPVSKMLLRMRRRGQVVVTGAWPESRYGVERQREAG